MTNKAASPKVKKITRYNKAQLVWLSMALLAKQDSMYSRALADRSKKHVDTIYIAVSKAMESAEKRNYGKLKKIFKPAIKVLRKNNLLDSDLSAFFRDTLNL